jgi:hypothetical protein
MIGTPVVTDAARYGSYAHRVRAFWTNLATPSHLQLVLDAHQRPPGRLVDDVLDEGRTAQLSHSTDAYPRYPCNTQGQPLCALPTLMAKQRSFAFREGGPGMIWSQGSTLVEPNADERERIMGFPPGATLTASVSNADRHNLTGRAMDMFCLEALMATILVLAPAQNHTARVMMTTLAPPSAVPCSSIGLASYLAVNAVDEHPHAAAAELRLEVEDVWADTPSMNYLQSGTIPLERNTRLRVLRRCQGYAWRDSRLLRVHCNGTTKEVPPRPHLINGKPSSVKPMTALAILGSDARMGYCCTLTGGRA